MATRKKATRKKAARKKEAAKKEAAKKAAGAVHLWATGPSLGNIGLTDGRCAPVQLTKNDDGSYDVPERLRAAGLAAGLLLKKPEPPEE